MPQDSTELPPFPENGVYKVMFEVSAGFRLRRELPMDLHLELGDGRRVDIHIETEYDDRSELPTPILLVVFKVTAADLRDAVEWSYQWIQSLLNLFGVTANAYASSPELTYAVDVSAKTTERKFIQVDSKIARSSYPARTELLDYDAAYQFACLVLDADDDSFRDRMMRAAQQYQFALKYATAVDHVLASAHAYMAVETLTPLAKRKLEMSDLELAELEVRDGNIKYLRRGRDIPNAADNRSRRKVIFNGDSRLARDARSISDGFAHGYASFDTLVELSARSYLTILTRVRHVMIEISGLSNDLQTRVLIPKFEKPLSSFQATIFEGIFDQEVSVKEASQRPLDEGQLIAKCKSYDPESGKYEVEANLTRPARAKITITDGRTQR